MPVALKIGLGLFYFLFPVGVLILHERGGLFGRLNPVVTCYVVGILIGNSGLLTAPALKVLDLITTVTVPLSIPLMLFSIDLRRWKKLTGRAGLSMIGAGLAVTISVFVGHFLFRESLTESWQLGGMLIGVYTGGTPNMAAIRTALGVSTSLYLTANTADIAMSSIYFLFVLTAAQKVLGAVLPSYRSLGHRGSDSFQTEGSFRGILSRENRLPLAAALGLSVAIFGIAGGISLILPENIGAMIAILLITSLALLATCVPAVRKIPYTFQAGEYFILVFCLAVGSLADVARVLATAPQVMAYVALAVFGSLALHILYCRLLKIDVDTMLVTSTSAIMSPPFVGLTAVALGNREGRHGGDHHGTDRVRGGQLPGCSGGAGAASLELAVALRERLE